MFCPARRGGRVERHFIALDENDWIEGDHPDDDV